MDHIRQGKKEENEGGRARGMGQEDAGGGRGHTGGGEEKTNQSHYNSFIFGHNNQYESPIASLLSSPRKPDFVKFPWASPTNVRQLI